MFFFSAAFALLALTSLGLALPIIIEFLETGLVPRFPTAILATGMMVLAFLSLVCGLILDTVTHGRREIKRLHYLSIPAVRQRDVGHVSDMAAEDSPDLKRTQLS